MARGKAERGLITQQLISCSLSWLAAVVDSTIKRSFVSGVVCNNSKMFAWYVRCSTIAKTHLEDGTIGQCEIVVNVELGPLSTKLSCSLLDSTKMLATLSS